MAALTATSAGNGQAPTGHPDVCDVAKQGRALLRRSNGEADPPRDSRSIADLEQAINQYIETVNEDPKPFR